MFSNLGHLEMFFVFLLTIFHCVPTVQILEFCLFLFNLKPHIEEYLSIHNRQISFYFTYLDWVVGKALLCENFG